MFHHKYGSVVPPMERLNEYNLSLALQIKFKDPNSDWAQILNMKAMEIKSKWPWNGWVYSKSHVLKCKVTYIKLAENLSWKKKYLYYSKYINQRSNNVCFMYSWLIICSKFQRTYITVKDIYGGKAMSVLCMEFWRNYMTVRPCLFYVWSSEGIIWR